MELIHWALDHTAELLKQDNTKGWTGHWLEVLKEENAKGFHPTLPEFGFGDPTSYKLIEDVVRALKDHPHPDPDSDPAPQTQNPKPQPQPQPPALILAPTPTPEPTATPTLTRLAGGRAQGVRRGAPRRRVLQLLLPAGARPRLPHHMGRLRQRAAGSPGPSHPYLALTLTLALALALTLALALALALALDLTLALTPILTPSLMHPRP